MTIKALPVQAIRNDFETCAQHIAQGKEKFTDVQKHLQSPTNDINIHNHISKCSNHFDHEVGVNMQAFFKQKIHSY